ncbi:flagellar basal body protein FliL [Hydrogenovibrio sp. SC-1]|uniref:flagellar basal body-associated FliL family protein n=1 Tax=Hydrogenovibrio sp. SC-1 TaxID=2065820 RepID=UPI000C7C1399|nr:flagellar basal body-associated FliL family protein [Hydrogenovibrio sp. SC-1]PLA73898.1 flagellar basal body protein FliL [Hydrogenovibrio sp. SC-1]
MAEEEQQETKKSGGKGLIITLVVVLVLLLIGISVLAFFLLKGDGGDHAKSEDGQQIVEHVDEDAIAVPPTYKQYDPPEPGSAPQYYPMEPFVVNFKGEGQAKFLAVTLKFMSYYPQVIVDMENYRPILRNDITALLRVQTFSEMNLDNGPEILRNKILTKAREVLEKQKIYPDLLEDVYFERFVMQ